MDESEIRLDQYLTAKFSEHSRSKIQSMIKSGAFLLDGQTVRSSLLLKGGEIVEVMEIQTEVRTLEPQDMNLDIIFEDDQIAVLNKPAGIIVHPGSGNPNGTLLNGLLHHFKTLSSLDAARPGIIHRLDKETSGVIVIAKTDRAHQIISDQFADRTVKKIYKALVWGQVDDEGKVSGKIGRDPRNRQIFKLGVSNGKDSLTYYTLDAFYQPLSLVTLRPKTGRTHQIRVHMKHIGHPILNDTIYSGGKSLIKSFHQKHVNLLKSVFKRIDRMALHAYSLEIEHPITKKRMRWMAPIPAVFKEVMAILENVPED